jgi:cell division protein ZapA
MDQPTRVVSVEIHGQQYPIRCTLDPAYVAELAAYVDEKMRLASRETPGSDTLKIAVLAALNIADEFFRTRDDVRSGHDSLAHRTAELERMLDLALGLADPSTVAPNASTAYAEAGGREEPRTAAHR